MLETTFHKLLVFFWFIAQSQCPFSLSPLFSCLQCLKIRLRHPVCIELCKQASACQLTWLDPHSSAMLSVLKV